MQNQSVLERMGKFTGITSKCAIPLDSPDAIPVAKQPPITDQVVIGTPGTIKKWMALRKLSTRDIRILVFDEADHMLAEVVFILLKSFVPFFHALIQGVVFITF